MSQLYPSVTLDHDFQYTVHAYRLKDFTQRRTYPYARYNVTCSFPPTKSFKCPKRQIATLTDRRQGGGHLEGELETMDVATENNLDVTCHDVHIGQPKEKLHYKNVRELT